MWEGEGKLKSMRQPSWFHSERNKDDEGGRKRRLEGENERDGRKKSYSTEHGAEEDLKRAQNNLSQGLNCTLWCNLNYSQATVVRKSM